MSFQDISYEKIFEKLAEKITLDKNITDEQYNNLSLTINKCRDIFKSYLGINI